MDIPGNSRLKSCPEWPAGIDWPIPIDQRLDELCELADEAGADTTRKELVAALLLASPTTPMKLKSLIDKYRVAEARRAAIVESDEDRVLHIRERKPGRKSKRLKTAIGL
jgi:hypothetical protein